MNIFITLGPLADRLSPILRIYCLLGPSFDFYHPDPCLTFSAVAGKNLLILPSPPMTPNGPSNRPQTYMHNWVLGVKRPPGRENVLAGLGGEKREKGKI